jgi:hypothetical protein
MIPFPIMRVFCDPTKKHGVKPEKDLSPREIFVKNLPKNILMALFTVPAECLAVRRILHLLHFPDNPPTTYIHSLKQLGLKNLFAGSMSRIGYCLGGNFITLQGIHQFGSDFTGLFKIALIKNTILPLSLLANARQSQLSWKDTLSFVHRGSLDRGAHISFFCRNLLANTCLLPGFHARDYCYTVLEEKNTFIPSSCGLIISTITSTVMNVILKPFFTGKYPLNVRYIAVKRFPGAFPICLRLLPRQRN